VLSSPKAAGRPYPAGERQRQRLSDYAQPKAGRHCLTNMVYFTDTQRRSWREARGQRGLSARFGFRVHAPISGSLAHGARLAPLQDAV